MRTRYILAMVVLLTLGFGAGQLLAATATGSLDSPAPPDSTYSYNLEDIYNRLTSGAAGSQSAFTEPTGGPTASTGHDLEEIMDVAPALDDAAGATQAYVVAGKTAWGLTSGQWGPMTGTMPDNGAATITPSTIEQTIAAGYHDGSGYVEGDADLTAGNIRSGANIFGVAGDPDVVDTSSGDATAGDILSGKTAWVDGAEVIGTSNPAGVPKTGQIECYYSDGITGTCTCGDTNCPAGQDGDLEMGVAWPNPRFTDNGDGTVTDNLTGLIWLKNANCFGTRDWSTALNDANTLNSGECGLTDGSVEGDWRLPNRFELESLLNLEYYGPPVPDTAGTGQWSEGDPFNGVQLSVYWSSTTAASGTSFAWGVYLSLGVVDGIDKTYDGYYVWPVRGGQ